MQDWVYENADNGNTFKIYKMSLGFNNLMFLILLFYSHYALPLYPTIPGMEEFKGQVVHSHDYRSPEVFRGKRVVCLGAAASGQDIAIDVSSEAKLVSVVFNFYVP